MIINRSNLALLFTGFKAVFQGAFETAQSQWDRVAMLIPSSTSLEQYAWLGAMPRFREWIGDRVIANLRTHDFTIKNRSFEVTIGVDRDHIEDDQYGVYQPMIAELGMQAKTHPDELVFPLLAGGFEGLCYDGQPFFDTDHPVLDEHDQEQSVSNFGGGAGTPWFLLDTTRPIKPFIFQKRRDYDFVAMDQANDEAVFMRKEYRFGVDARCNAGYALWQLAYASRQTLDLENYAAARAAMFSFKADGGKPLAIRPNLLVVPPQLEKAALEVLKVERQANGATNPYQGTAEVMVCPWLV